MSRVEEIEQVRADVAELTAKFGLAMIDSNGSSLVDKAKDLRLARVILSPPKTVFPCAAELKDRGAVDPCLIVPSNLPVELMPKHKSIAVGGQVLSISRSMYALSPYMTGEAARAQGYWNGQPMPMLVSVQGNYKFLVQQKAFFFRFETWVGSDIDELSPMEPDVMGLKLNRYYKSDDLSGELTIIVAEY
jgi:hypothetical protein